MRIIAGIVLMFSLPAAAAECVASSGPQATPLVELFTSEGCSSCPPADRWLATLGAAARGRVVPLAFHVGYWDDLGWKDPYADARFTARQKEYARRGGAGGVYTPEVVVGGRELRDWYREESFEERIGQIQRLPARAAIEIRSRPRPGGGVIAVVTAQSSAPARDLALVTVATQDGLASQVSAGENRGAHLRHDFVVRDLVVMRGFASKGGAAGASALAEFPLRAPAAKMSVVAFVQDVRTGEVLQSLATPFCSAP
jgi:hypothetical protein